MSKAKQVLLNQELPGSVPSRPGVRILVIIDASFLHRIRKAQLLDM